MTTQETVNLITIPAEVELKPAGFWIRLGAFSIDLFCIWLSCVYFYLTNPFLNFPNPDFPSYIAKLNHMFQIDKMLLVGLIYHTLTVGVWGRGLGKFLAGILVVTKDGGKVNYGTAFGRVLACYLSTLTILVGYLMVIFSQNKLALHDRICGTKVVYKKQTGLFRKIAVIVSGIFLLNIASLIYYVK